MFEQATAQEPTGSCPDGPDAAGMQSDTGFLSDPAGFLNAATEVLAKLPSQLWRTGNDGFADIAAAMDALAAQLECARVGLVQEAQSRGVVDQSPSSSSAAWLLAHSRHLEPADAARTADLAKLCAQPKNQVIAAAVAGGTVTVRKAVTVLRQLRHWADGGPTSLTNLALLCAHPTYVHQRDLTATVTAHDVTWHT